MCALVSSAISAAFSPPHVPARSLGGLRPVGSHGPRTAAAAANTTAALVSMETSLPIYPPQTTLRHHDYPAPLISPCVPWFNPGNGPTAPPRWLRRLCRQ